MFLGMDYDILDVLKSVMFLDSMEDSQKFAEEVWAAIKHPCPVKPAIEITPDGFVIRIGELSIGMYEYSGTYFIQRRFDCVHYQGQIELQELARNTYYWIIDRLTAPQAKQS